eukprot:2300654-Prymnesium_polylepis.1
MSTLHVALCARSTNSAPSRESVRPMSGGPVDSRPAASARLADCEPRAKLEVRLEGSTRPKASLDPLRALAGARSTGGMIETDSSGSVAVSRRWTCRSASSERSDWERRSARSTPGLSGVDDCITAHADIHCAASERDDALRSTLHAYCTPMASNRVSSTKSRLVSW